MKKGMLPGILVGVAAAAGLSVLALAGLSGSSETSESSGASEALDPAAESVHVHEYTEEVAEEATCTHGGRIVLTCASCGDASARITDPKEHEYELAETKEATFEHGGYELYKCKVCGDEYRENEAPAIEKTIADAEITLKTDAFEYTGKEITFDLGADAEAVKVQFGEDLVLKAGEDYSLDYEDNISVGTAKVTINGEDDWTGSRSLSFVIYPAPAEVSKISTKDGISVQWEAVAGADGYELLYSKSPEFGEGSKTFKVEDAAVTSLVLDDSTEEGTRYYVKMRAYKEHNGKLLGSFGKAKEAVVTAEIGELSLRQTAFSYAGKAINAETVLKDKQGRVLKKDFDYTCKYQNNTEPGTATVTVTGIGVYTGTATAQFTIRPADIKDIKLVGLSEVYLYEGKPVQPSPSLVIGDITLRKGTDYDISYENNSQVGSKATMTFTFKGRFSGTITKSFRIESSGWETVNGETYFVEDGKRYTTEGLKAINGDTYYFSSNGAIQKGWQKIGDGYYCFDRLNGKMYTSTNVDGIAVDASGLAASSDYNTFRITTMMTARKVLLKQTKPTDTMEEKRLKCFNWILSFPYHQWRTLKDIYDTSVDWEMTFANDIFRKSSGCCVSESAALAFLFREIGYTDVYICHDSGHCWVMIGDKLFDPVFAEAKSFEKNYNVKPYDYRSNPLRKRRVDGKAFDGAPS